MRRLDPWGPVLALAGLVIFLLHGFGGTLTRDLALYSYSGQQLVEGVPPYVSVLNRAGPLAHMVPGGGAAIARLIGTDDLLTRSRPDPRVRERPRTRDGITRWPLTRHGPAAGLQAYKFRIERRDPPRELPTHEGHDWMYVLNGRLRLLLGEDELIIEPGEAVEFSTWTPHWFGAVDGPVEVIAILGPQGERVHLHS